MGNIILINKFFTCCEIWAWCYACISIQFVTSRLIDSREFHQSQKSNSCIPFQLSRLFIHESAYSRTRNVKNSKQKFLKIIWDNVIVRTPVNSSRKEDCKAMKLYFFWKVLGGCTRIVTEVRFQDFERIHVRNVEQFEPFSFATLSIDHSVYLFILFRQ